MTLTDLASNASMCRRLQTLLPVSICLLLVVAFSNAGAEVLCARKTRSGTVAEGASVKIRSTCRSNEIAVDAAALGLQGPAGNDGSPGVDGLPCWDLDGDATCDAEEDRDGELGCDARDCRGFSSGCTPRELPCGPTSCGPGTAACEPHGETCVLAYRTDMPGVPLSCQAGISGSSGLKAVCCR